LDFQPFYDFLSGIPPTTTPLDKCIVAKTNCQVTRVWWPHSLRFRIRAPPRRVSSPCSAWSPGCGGIENVDNWIHTWTITILKPLPGPIGLLLYGPGPLLQHQDSGIRNSGCGIGMAGWLVGWLGGWIAGLMGWAGPRGLAAGGWPDWIAGFLAKEQSEMRNAKAKPKTETKSQVIMIVNWLGNERHTQTGCTKRGLRGGAVEVRTAQRGLMELVLHNLCCSTACTCLRVWRWWCWFCQRVNPQTAQRQPFFKSPKNFVDGLTFLYALRSVQLYSTFRIKKITTFIDLKSLTENGGTQIEIEIEMENGDHWKLQRKQVQKLQIVYGRR